MDETPHAESWEDCYERLAPKLVLFARQWLPHPQDAEDVVQEAFIRMWKRRGRGDFNDAYFFAATRSAAIDHQRSGSRREHREIAFTSDPLFESVEAPSALSLQDIEFALSSLPPEQREAVVLRVWGGVAFAEIGRITGASVHTAASRYRYGIAALKKHLDFAMP